MNLPQKIKVAGHYYSVIFPYKFKERDGLRGQTDHNILEIVIKEVDGGGNQYPESRILETFIHEILHAINYCAGETIFSKDVNEQEDQVSALSEGILQVLVDNEFLKCPQVIEYQMQAQGKVLQQYTECLQRGAKGPRRIGEKGKLKRFKHGRRTSI